MPTVETTITVSIAEEADLGEMEQRVWEAVWAAGRALVVAAAGVVEEAALVAGSELRREKRRPREVLTRFGWVRLARWQVVRQGRYRYPLDERLGLAPRCHASPWVRAQAVALATRFPYRQAAALLQEMVSGFVDHRTLHAWVQAAGAQLVAQEDEAQEATFGRGQAPPEAGVAREIVVAEVDGTFVRAQREGQPAFEVRLGLLFTGKELESASARHRRYRLQERVLYGGVESADEFGERLFLAGEARVGLSRARHLLLIGDGADWIEHLAGHERWKATYQLDWWHILRHLRRAFPTRPDLVARLQQVLRQGDAAQLLRLVALARVTGAGDPQQVAELETYLHTNARGFYGARRLRPLLSAKARLVAVNGSGAIEKQMDVTIGRRFKGPGMRWTRRGANRLLKLRLRELEREAA